MRVIHNGRIIETDSDLINGRVIISERNYEKFAYHKEQKTWEALQQEMLIRKPWVLPRKPSAHYNYEV